MALVQKTALFQMRLEPDLYAAVREAAEHHRMSLAALVRWLMLEEVNRNEARKKRDAAKAAREAAEAAPAPVPEPETFQLEKTPAGPAKGAAKGKPGKNRAQRRAEEAEAKREAKRERKNGK